MHVANQSKLAFYGMPIGHIRREILSREFIEAEPHFSLTRNIKRFTDRLIGCMSQANLHGLDREAGQKFAETESAFSLEKARRQTRSLSLNLLAN
jgi:hypothetical protein